MLPGSFRRQYFSLVRQGSRRISTGVNPLISVHPIAGHSGCVEMRLQKPPVNTFDFGMMETFVGVLRELEGDEAVRGLVLTSANPKVYSAGLELTAMVDPDPAEFRRFWGAFEDMVEAYYMTPLATVAAISGSAPALGAVLALASDYRVMLDSPKARIGLNETALGMLPPRWLVGLTAQTLGTRAAERHLQCSSRAAARLEPTLSTCHSRGVAASPPRAIL
jgi:Delta3-Delta2-enoyl-CoA isomerase